MSNTMSEYCQELSEERHLRPNLFIIGAMKAGTTSLHNYLNAHPSISMSEPKEPCYFVHPKELNWPQMSKMNLWANEDKYLALFDCSTGTKVLGESSTPYTKFPHIHDVPARIYQFNPKARFIYVLRDPVERTVSHYLHELRRGYENRDMLTAIQENPLYCDTSNYDLQLRQFLEHFELHQFYFLTFEEMISDTLGTVRKIFDWLNIDATFEPPNLVQRAHETPNKFYQKGRIYRLRYSWPFKQFITLLPHQVRQIGLKTFVREVDRSAELSNKEVVAKYLRPIQQPQVQNLSTLVGRSFPEWTTLWKTESVR